MPGDYVDPERVSSSRRRRILAYLNRVRRAEELASTLDIPLELARRLLAARRRQKGFTDLRQVREVGGIGPQRFAQIIDRLGGPDDAEPDAEIEIQAVIATVEAAQDRLLAMPGVVAVAAGLRTVADQETDEPCVKVFVERKRPPEQLPDDLMLPSSLPSPAGGTVRVDVDEMSPPIAGASGALNLIRSGPGSSSGLRYRKRPAMGGFSVGHYRITAGTIAISVRDRRRQGIYYILSNNHVLANVNTGRVGDPIVQPGPSDGGTLPRDTIARLCRWIPIRFGPGTSNLCDAAIAQTRFCDVDHCVFGIGYPPAIRRRAAIALGEQVQKTGRTTGYTRGRIVAVHGSVKVNYPGTGVAEFRQQMFTTPMSEGGDSGSLVLDLDGNAVGLLFAGSTTHTIMNYIEDVQNSLAVLVAERIL